MVYCGFKDAFIIWVSVVEYPVILYSCTRIITSKRREIHVIPMAIKADEAVTHWYKTRNEKNKRHRNTFDLKKNKKYLAN